MPPYQISNGSRYFGLAADVIPTLTKKYGLGPPAFRFASLRLAHKEIFISNILTKKNVLFSTLPQ